MAGYSLTIPAQDASGWTVLPASTNNIYVSSSGGNDANPGTSGSPVATIAAGKALLSTGTSSTLFLKAGDSWSEAVAWTYSGASRAAPFIITSYGTGARPKLSVGGSNGFDCTSPGAVGMSHVWIVGIEFYADKRDPASGTYDASVDGTTGIYMLSPGSDILVEDCKISFFTDNITIENGSPSDIRLRRNVITDAYAHSGNAEGIFVGGISDLLVDGNVLDHNGWNATIPVARTVFNHGFYGDEGTRWTLSGNMISNSGSFGIKIASDTFDGLVDVVVSGNILFGNVNGINIKGSNNPSVNYIYRQISITGNVLSGQGGSIATVAQQFGTYMNSVDTLAETGNYFINSTGGTATGGDSQGTRSVFYIDAYGNKSITFTGNTIHGWAGESIDNNASPASGITITPNDVSATNWPRDITTYDAFLGGPGTTPDFVTKIRGQSKAAYNTAMAAPAVSNYITLSGGGVIDTYNKRATFAVYGLPGQHFMPRAGSTKDVAYRRQIVGLYPFEGPAVTPPPVPGTNTMVRHSLFGAAQRRKFFRVTRNK